MLWGKQLLGGVLAVTALAACAPQNENQSLSTSAQTDGIIGGVDVPKGNRIITSIVAVYDAYSSQLCTGSLLDNNTVMTAAHCLGSNVDGMFIMFDTQLSGTSERRQADQMAASLIWQDQLAKNQDPVTGDIALIHFKGTVPAGYAPATFLTDASLLKKNAKVVLAGYGISNGTTREGAGTLRAAFSTISDPKSDVGEVQLDQRNGSGACHGDSGGPAYIYRGGQYFLWGVTSRGSQDPKNDCTQFAIYTNALNYSVWIEATKKKFADAAATPVAPPKSKKIMVVVQ